MTRPSVDSVRTADAVPRRTRLLAALTGAHIPYLDHLPSSETIRYSQAGLALVVSVVSSAAGWALVASWAMSGQSRSAQWGAAGAGALVAALVVWSIDRELISGQGRLAVRATIGAVNAVLIGEVVLLALFNPFVAGRLAAVQAEAINEAVLEAESVYQAEIRLLDRERKALEVPESVVLIAARTDERTARQDVAALEDELADLGRLRTAEATGLIVTDADGNQLTTGRIGDQGVATASIDSEIARSTSALERAVSELDAVRARIGDLKADHAAAEAEAEGGRDRLDGERSRAEVRRRESINAAEALADRPTGVLGRVHALHSAAWSDLVLAIAVSAIHLAILSAELSVVLWAVNDRRRGQRLYPSLVEEIERDAASHLTNLAQRFSVRSTGTEVPDPSVRRDDAPQDAQVARRPLRGVGADGTIRTRPPGDGGASVSPGGASSQAAAHPPYEAYRGARLGKGAGSPSGHSDSVQLTFELAGRGSANG